MDRSKACVQQILPVLVICIFLCSSAGRQTDLTVFGVFDGRSPCKEVARELNINVKPDCFKLKWRLTLYKDFRTGKPAAYRLEGTLYRKKVRQGKWEIVTGTNNSAHAVVYKLDPGDSQSAMYFLKGDDNVLFFLGSDGNLLVGNTDFSYTLNRVK